MQYIESKGLFKSFFMDMGVDTEGVCYKAYVDQWLDMGFLYTEEAYFDRFQPSGESFGWADDEFSFGTLQEVMEVLWGSRNEVTPNKVANKTHLGRFDPLYRNYWYKAHSCIYQAEIEEGGMVSYFRDYKDYKRGRRTKQKIGRYIKYVMPRISDADLENIVKDWNFAFQKEDYTLKTGSSREDFAFAYSDKLAKSKDPYTCEARKSLHNSCMRGIELGGHSPAEVYASGDFHIAWVENSRGEVAGRVVIRDDYDGRPQAGPCYGVCEQSLDMLEEYVRGINAVEYEYATWEGAKILRIEVGELPLGPYSDLEVGVDECGSDYFEIVGSSGEYSLSSTSGHISGFGCMCDCCEEHLSAYEMTRVDDYYTYCEYCRDGYCFCSDISEEWFRNEDQKTYYYYAYGRQYTGYCSIHELGDYCVYSEHLSEHWLKSDTVYSDHLEDYLPTKYAEEHPELMGEEEERNIA